LPRVRHEAARRRVILRGYPSAIRADSGRFTSSVVTAWAQGHRVRHNLIQPGRPIQNGASKSFNGKFRDEYLSDPWFQPLHEARTAISSWRQDYNEVRPYCSIGRIPLAKFAELHRQLAGDVAQQPANTSEESS
jgi:putative transposase